MMPSRNLHYRKFRDGARVTMINADGTPAWHGIVQRTDPESGYVWVLMVDGGDELDVPASYLKRGWIDPAESCGEWRLWRYAAIIVAFSAVLALPFIIPSFM